MPDPNCPKREGRTLILCFDGTGDSFDADVSRLGGSSRPGHDKTLTFYL